jgi:hypothetical protein
LRTLNILIVFLSFSIKAKMVKLIRILLRITIFWMTVMREEAYLLLVPFSPAAPSGHPAALPLLMWHCTYIARSIFHRPSKISRALPKRYNITKAI